MARRARAPAGIPSSQLLLLTVALEGALAVIGLGWFGWRTGGFAGLAAFGGAGPRAAAAAGLWVAALLALAAGVLVRLGPRTRFSAALARVCRDVLKPTFGSARARDLVLIGAAAGLGEEILFRGALQPAVGLVPAAVVFGACHVFSRDTVALGIWAFLAGLAFGWLFDTTGGLLAPVVAHGTYDVLALAYIRWGPLPRVT
jgi:hypothetical protein